MKLLPFHFSNTCTFIENIITPVYVSGCTFVPFHAVFKRSNCFCVCGDGEPPSRNKRGIMLADTFVNRPSRLAEEHTWIPLKRVKQSWVFLIKSDVLPIWRMPYSQSSSRNIPHTNISCQNFFKYSSPSESPPKSFWIINLSQNEDAWASLNEVIEICSIPVSSFSCLFS